MITFHKINMQMRLVDKTVLFKRNKKGEAEKLTQKIIRLG